MITNAMNRTISASLVILLLTICNVVAPKSASAYDPNGKSKQNALLLDLGGQGLLFTLSYERFITEGFAVRTGFGVFPEIFGNGMNPVLSLMLSGITDPDSGEDHFECGAGIVTVPSESGKVLGSLSIGYRYQDPADRVIFRAALTPFISDKGIMPWVSLGVGTSF
jgi:hypothetical protein